MAPCEARARTRLLLAAWGRAAVELAPAVRGRSSGSCSMNGLARPPPSARTAGAGRHTAVPAIHRRADAAAAPTPAAGAAQHSRPWPPASGRGPRPPARRGAAPRGPGHRRGTAPFLARGPQSPAQHTPWRTTPCLPAAGLRRANAREWRTWAWNCPAAGQEQPLPPPARGWSRGMVGRRRRHTALRKEEEGGYKSDMWAPHIRSTSTSSQFDTLTV